MKRPSNPRHARLSALLLTLALCVTALAAPQPAQACGPYGPAMSPKEREVVSAAQGRLPADGTVYIVSYGKVRIEDDRAVVSLELYDGVDERSYWRTFRFVRSEQGWLPAPRKRA